MNLIALQNNVDFWTTILGILPIIEKSNVQLIALQNGVIQGLLLPIAENQILNQ